MARQRMGYFDCSTCPERLIFDFLRLDGGKYLADSFEPTNPFVGKWTYAESNEPEKWCHLTHVDIWSVAQVVQRRGVDAELTLLEMAKRDSARLWPPRMQCRKCSISIPGRTPACNGKALWSSWKNLVKTGLPCLTQPRSQELIPLVGLPVLVRMLRHPQPLRLRYCPVLRQRQRQPERQPALEGQRASLLPQARARGALCQRPQFHLQRQYQTQGYLIQQSLRKKALHRQLRLGRHSPRQRRQGLHQQSLHSQSQLQSQVQCQLLLRKQRQPQRQGKPLRQREP